MLEILKSIGRLLFDSKKIILNFLRDFFYLFSFPWIFYGVNPRA